MEPIKNRYDFVYVFDVQDGNPNGDPDAGNLPRVDPETGMGLVTDVCLKRKVRNYVQLKNLDQDKFDIFVKEKAVLNNLIKTEYDRLNIDLEAAPADAADGKKRETKGKGQGTEIDKARAAMCGKFYDIRAFGAVMSTGPNAGQVRGPVQMTFARSVEPIVSLEHSITRMAVATEEEAKKQGGDNRTMGRKTTVPYGLYLSHGFISASFASQTGFSMEDLDLFWEALKNMFEQDHSAARGFMSARKLIVFKHADALGSAPAHDLFDLVKIRKLISDEKPARKFSDYEIKIDESAKPDRVEIITKL